MINPLFFCYGQVLPVSWAAGSAIIVTGRGNRHHVGFQQARDRGAMVYAYLNFIARPDSTNDPLDLGVYMGDVSKVPLWGNNRTGWPRTKFADIRVGSAWVDWSCDYLARVIRENRVDGVFLDTLGARPWGGLVAWESWPQAERDEWTNGAVDLARRLDEVRRAENPSFDLIHNNIWQDDPRGEQYGGVCLEHAKPTEFHTMYAQRPFGQPLRRRVMIIANNPIEAQTWATVPGVTHVTSVNTKAGENYMTATPPVVDYNDLRIAEMQAYVRQLEAERDALRVFKDVAAGKIDELNEKLAIELARIAAARQAVQEASAVLDGVA